MKINVEQLRVKQENKFYFQEVLSDIQIEELKVSKVEVEFFIELVGEEVIVKGNYNAHVETSCVRCLESIQIEVSGEFFGDYKGSKEYQEYIESLGKEVHVYDDMIEELKDGQVDISSLVRDYIILDMPQYPACEPQCNGLEELEKYRNDGIDSRWQQLLDLKN